VAINARANVWPSVASDSGSAFNQQVSFGKVGPVPAGDVVLPAMTLRRARSRSPRGGKRYHCLGRPLLADFTMRVREGRAVTNVHSSHEHSAVRHRQKLSKTDADGLNAMAGLLHIRLTPVTARCASLLADASRHVSKAHAAERRCDDERWRSMDWLAEAVAGYAIDFASALAKA